MSKNEVGSLCEAMRAVPTQWQAEFVRFVEEGEGSDEFIAFLEHDAPARSACEMALQNDTTILCILDASAETDDRQDRELKAVH
jgi:hypothetical protein